MTGGNPANHLNIPEAPRSVFYMGLEVILSIGKFVMTLIGFGKLGQIKGFAVPHGSGPHLVV